MDLTPDDIKTIREMKRWMQTNGQAGTLRPSYQRKVPRMISVGPVNLKLIKAPSGGIPGRVGTLLGGVTCDVWTEDTNTSQISDSGDKLKVENWSTSVVCDKGDRFGIAGRVNNSWYIIAEDCNDEGSTVSPGTGGGTLPPPTNPIDPKVPTLITTSTFSNASFTGGGTPVFE